MSETELVKTVPLSRQQYQTLRASVVQPTGAAGVIAELLSRLAEMEGAAWDKAARMAGFDGLYDLHEQGFRMEICWLQNCLEIRKATPCKF